MFKKITIGLAVLGAAASAGYLWFVRPWLRNWGASEEEVQRAMPGDDLVRNPNFAATHAISIRARPGEIWPWLVQMETGRAGWSTYTLTEKLIGVRDPHMHRLIPEFQQLAVGEIMLIMPGAVGFKVVSIDPNRSLVTVLVMNDKDASGAQLKQEVLDTWTFLLEECASEQTRLMMRLRGRLAPFWRLVLEPGESVVTRKRLLGIKQRAEEAHSPPEAGGQEFNLDQTSQAD